MFHVKQFFAKFPAPREILQGNVQILRIRPLPFRWPSDSLISLFHWLFDWPPHCTPWFPADLSGVPPGMANARAHGN
jgi:hypothetical protein